MNAADIAVVRKYLGKDYPQSRFAYDVNNNAEYIGVAARGAGAADASWQIAKLTYDENGNVTVIQTSEQNQVWNDRATVTYA